MLPVDFSPQDRESHVEQFPSRMEHQPQPDRRSASSLGARRSLLKAGTRRIGESSLGARQAVPGPASRKKERVSDREHVRKPRPRTGEGRWTGLTNIEQHVQPERELPNVGRGENHLDHACNASRSQLARRVLEEVS